MSLSFLQAQDSDYSLKNNLYMTYGSQFGFGNVELKQFDFGFFDFGISYGFRYNIVDISDDFAIGFDLNPEIGFYSGELDQFSNDGLLGIHIPAFISLNFGVGSTYDSDKNIGVSIKPGVQLMMGPLVGIESSTDFKKTALVPVLQLSGRFWKRSTNKLREIFIKVGSKPASREDSDGTFIAYLGGAYFIGY